MISVLWATRAGSDHTAVETLVKLLPSIKNDLKKEIGSIGDLKLEFA